MRKILTCCLLLLFLFSVTAQDNDSLAINKAAEIRDQGIAFFQKNAPDSALILLHQAAKEYQNLQSWEMQIACLNDIAYIHYYRRNVSEFSSIVHQAHDGITKHDLPKNQTYITSLINLNAYYYMIGDYPKSIALLKDALEEMETNEDPQQKYILAVLFQNLGNAYRFMGGYPEALDYLNQSMQAALGTLGPEHYFIGNIYRDQGRVFQALEKIDSAFHYYEKSQLLFDPFEDGVGFDYKLDNLLMLSDLWVKEKNTIQSKALINKVLAIAKENRPAEEIHSYEKLAGVFIAEKKYQEAIRSLEKANQMANQYTKRETPPLFARRYEKMAEAYFLQGNLDSALLNYHRALSVLSPDFTASDPLKNPAVDQIFEPLKAIAILQKKAEVLWDFYQKNQQRKYISAAFSAYHTASQIIQELRKGILSMEAKNILTESTIAIFEGAIKTQFELNRISPDQKHLSQAFHLAESNKGLLLLEAINKQAALGGTGLPDSLLQKEKEWRLQLSFLQKQLLEKQEGAKENTNKIFALKKKLEVLYDHLELEYPRYYEAKYKNTPADLATIQRLLNKSKSVLLEYFVGEEKIYLFALNGKNIALYELKDRDQLLKKISHLQSFISHPDQEQSAADSYQEFTRHAHEVYQLALAPAEAQFQENASLIIIPDHLFNYLPFEILLQEKANTQRPSYKASQLSYLLNDYTISYDYSATLQVKNQRKGQEKYETSFVGFAPSFQEVNAVGLNRSCQEDQLYQLKCSDREVSLINELMQGQAFSNQAASVANFNQVAPQSRIIHLATHACVDEDNHLLNKFFLTDSNLSSIDLYNLLLRAELTVLSACNTGSGKMVKGEGVMSLARSFISAGCASAVMSMWSVNDCTTSDIMVQLYHGLQAGHSKPEALRQAKLHYLKNVDQVGSHPYYWAAFLHFGNRKEMNFSSFPKYKYLLGIALVSFLFIAYCFRTR